MNTNRCKKILQSENLKGYLFILPWLIGFFVFTIYPIVMSFTMSFFDWDLFGERTFIGFGNYVEIFSNEIFHICLSNTLLYAFFSTLISVLFGILTAYILLSASWLNLALRTIIYLPSLVIGIAFSMMMAPIFDASEFGLINQFFKLFGWETQTWLSEPGKAVWVLIFMSLWGLGGPMIIFTAAFKNIDNSVIEAAKIDGASRFMTLVKINLPIIFPIIVYQLFMSLIGGVQVFDLALGLATASGTATHGMGNQNALGTLAYYLYRTGFGGADAAMGKASAIGWIIFFITAVFSVFILIFIKKSKYYTKN